MKRRIFSLENNVEHELKKERMDANAPIGALPSSRHTTSRKPPLSAPELARRDTHPQVHGAGSRRTLRTGFSVIMDFPEGN